MEHNIILFDYIKNDKIADFKEYISKHDNIDVNIRDDRGNYLIMYAVLKNNEEIIELLLYRGSKIDIIDEDGRSILYIPIKFGYMNIIKLLLEYNKTNIGISILDLKDKFTNIPLHYAIILKNVNMVKMLLKYNSDTNIRDSEGNNSLHLAIYSRNLEICNLILSDGNVNINARTYTGETALHIACNFQLENIVKLLVEKGIELDTHDYDNELTPLIYAVTLNNVNISKFLLKSGANPNLQDFTGNTVLHYTILEDTEEITHYLLTSENTKTKVNVNIYNISSKLPLHMLLEKTEILNDDILKILLNESNLNIQDNTGNSPLHLLIMKGLWKKYKNILSTKKLNIFIKNKNDKYPIDYVNKTDMPEFINTVTLSYLYILRHSNTKFTEDWENLCTKELYFNELTKEEKKIIEKYIKDDPNSGDLCAQIVKNKLLNLYSNKNISCDNTSIPSSVGKKCIALNTSDNVEFCSFTGITLDILIGLIYLLKKYPMTCTTASEKFITNKDLCTYYREMGIASATKCEFLNFEIVWVYKKLFFSENFTENFKKCLNNSKTKFIIVPLGIELKEGSHANYLIYDVNKKEIERFEPYGSSPPYKYNYNPQLLDNILTYKFNEIDKSIKYIKPSSYMPKISFQYLEIFESKSKKLGDPAGFCALWAIWYTDMRLSYPNIDRESLVKKLIKEIRKNNISFKTLIRNYSINIINIRDEIFKKVKLSINDWLNDKYTDEQLDKIVKELTKLLLHN